MTDQTPLDQAHAAMGSDPDDATLRLAWFDRLAASEMVLLLEEEATGETIKPQLFPVDCVDLVVAFDREDRLAEFAGGAAPYAALSGRVLAQMLAGAGLGVAVNLGTGAEMVLEPDAVRWLAETLDQTPDEVEDRPEELLPPAGLPDSLLTALDARLASAEGRAQSAYLVATRHGDGRRGHMLAFIAPAPGAEGALARLVGEALTFSGLEAAVLDVGFFAVTDPVCAPLAKVGLRFDIPDPVMPEPLKAPGSDPENPPRLR